MSFGRYAAVLVVLAAGASPAFAQSGYQTNFDDATGWTLAGGANGVVWKVDGTPSTMPGGIAQSGANSLNYNNSTNYNSGSSVTNSGTATSGSISLSGLNNPTLTFWCNFQTESGSEDATWGFDVRTVTLYPSGGTPVVIILGSSNQSANIDACGAMGTWHQHTVALGAAWTVVKVEFKFDTVDAIDNSNPGWSIDTLVVAGAGGGNTGTITTIVGWNFDSGLQGWTVGSSNAGVVWAADASPSTVAGGQAYNSAPNSLNYNNGTNYDAGAANKSEANSPITDLTGLTSPSLVFWCCYETESSSATYDQRYFEISNDNWSSTLLSVQLLGSGTASGLGDCAAMGTWHQHTVTLDPAWGAVQFRFRFDSVDSVSNTWAGWFVDDVALLAIGGGTVGGSLEGDDDDGGPGKKRWCGGSVADTRGSVFGFGIAGFVVAIAFLLGLLRKRA